MNLAMLPGVVIMPSRKRMDVMRYPLRTKKTLAPDGASWRDRVHAMTEKNKPRRQSAEPVQILNAFLIFGHHHGQPLPPQSDLEQPIYLHGQARDSRPRKTARSVN